MARRLRIAALLLVLLGVTLGTWLDRVYSTRWTGPLRVVLYPIPADRSDTAQEYVAQLSADQFESIERFFAREAEKYGVNVDAPIRITLAPPLKDLPPSPPLNASLFRAMAWSLHMRAWAWWIPPNPPGPKATIRIFMTYYDPARSPTLRHSVGLQKGLLGIANLFASSDMAGSNQVVIAHELLHTLGATDKYDGQAQPAYPDGYAEPYREPRYPQRYAELMAGRTVDSPSASHTPESLEEVVIGNSTAMEIGWRKK